MSYAIIGLVFVLLIVFGVLSAKNWHWLNIVFLILTFVAGVAACGAMAKSLKLRRDNINEAEKWEKQKEKNQEQANLAIVGSPNSISYDSKSLRGINELLTREMHGRGRVWAGGTVSFKGNDADDPNRIFKFSAARESVDPTNQLKGILLYAFADQPVAADNQLLPVTFVGTFRVVGETPEQIDIEPIFITSGENYTNPAGSWSLFEKMPADRRDAFKKVAYGGKSDLLGDNFDIALYREALETVYLPAEKIGLDPTSVEYESLIDRYLFDGMKLGEIANYIESQQDRKSVRF